MRGSREGTLSAAPLSAPWNQWLQPLRAGVQVKPGVRGTIRKVLWAVCDVTLNGILPDVRDVPRIVKRVANVVVHIRRTPLPKLEKLIRSAGYSGKKHND